MKQYYVLLVFLLCFLSLKGQQVYYLEVEPNQQVEVPGGTGGTLVNFDQLNGVVMVGGLHNREGIGRYIEINGNKLIIDSMSPMPDGTKEVVLRRKDGRLFYGLFTTLRGRISPMTLERQTKDTTIVKPPTPGEGL